MNIQLLDVAKIHPNNYNPNVMSKDKFEALIDFVKTHTVEDLDPIWVRHDGVDGFEVIDGEHRWRAVKDVGWAKMRGFVVDFAVDKARAFNVRKNRERGRLDAYKMGKLLLEESALGHTHNGVAKKFGLSRTMVTRYIHIYENHEIIRKKLGLTINDPLPFRKSRDILEQLNREERSELTETTEKPMLEMEEEETGQLRTFLTNYAKALKNTPEPNIKTDDVQTAIHFFKRLLRKKNITCPICGEEHLQWRCGHDF